jgi:hypothetical protein
MGATKKKGLKHIFEAAQIMERSEFTLKKWKREGAPGFSVVDGASMVDIETLKKWLDTQPKKKNYHTPNRQHEEKSEEAEPVTLLEAKRRKELALALRNEIAVAQLQGQLISKEEVEEGRVRRIQAVRGALMSLPGKLSGALAMRNADEIYEVLEGEIRQICEGFANG